MNTGSFLAVSYELGLDCRTFSEVLSVLTMPHLLTRSFGSGSTATNAGAVGCGSGVLEISGDGLATGDGLSAGAGDTSEIMGGDAGGELLVSGVLG